MQLKNLFNPFLFTDRYALTIAITDPQNGSEVHTSPIIITGTVSNNSAVVTVNNITAAVSNNSFTAEGIILSEGENTIVATAIDPYDQTATAGINVILSYITHISHHLIIIFLILFCDIFFFCKGIN